MDRADHTARWRITGSVQGVGFRWWTSRQAGELGLDGWVKNRPDGTVEILARGSRYALAELERRLQFGSPHARVQEVQRLEAGPAPSGSGFEIL